MMLPLRADCPGRITDDVRCSSRKKPTGRGDQMSEPKQVDVVIIGGGLAGLTAAYALKTMSSKENPVSFVVLEAGAQPGGPGSTPPEDFFDFGAGYIAG